MFMPRLRSVRAMPARAGLAAAAALLCAAPGAAPAGPLFTSAYLSYGTGLRPFCVASADLNRDAFPDLVIANQEPGTITVLMGLGDGAIGSRADFPVGASPIAVALSDLRCSCRA